MEKILQLKKVVNGGEQSIGEIGSFTYSAKRMGSAPTISATFYSFEENAVDVNCFVEFRGERYFIDKTPSSSKSNTDARYKYDLEFVSERVTLDNIYLYNMSYSDSSASQETTFKFSGTIHDLAERIQLSIDYSYGVKDYYKIIVDDGIDDDRIIWKVIDFKDTYVTNAIQEAFNTFNIPYYYTFNEDEREFHIGNEPASVIKETFKYGADDALLSIYRTNANYKVINKITGIGGTENLPYYYPNMSATGEHDINYDEKLESVFIDFNTLNKHVNIAKGCSLVYHIGYIKEDVEYYFALKYDKFTELGIYGGRTVVAQKAYSFVNTVQLMRDSGEDFTDDVNLTIELNSQENKTYKIRYDYAFSKIVADTSNAEILSYEVSSITCRDANVTILSDNEALLSFGDWSGTTYVFFKFKIRVSNQEQKWMAANMSFSWMKLSDISKEDFLSVEGEGLDIPISESGIKVGAPFEGGKITISPARNVIPFQKTLMPSIYRKTYGNERFYLAKNEDVAVKGTTNDGTEYEYTYNYGEYNDDGTLTERNEFNNPFMLGKQVEHILKIEDIKPTIKGATHTVGSNTYALDVFAEFGYDKDDNDEIGDDDEYKHPYFYGKLNPLGFNLFEHALEQGEMTISMTSGPCGACNFVIGVNDDKKNTVQVDANGNLLRDKDGNVRSGRKGLSKETPQDIQNNTTNTHVWIALKKDKDTYGVIHPNATGGIKPISLGDETKDTTGLVKADTFVITNILLPNEYIYAAEERLENEIKKYLMENNDEKFNFSIKFSRIYLEEHKQDILPYLNENSRIYLEYFNKEVAQPLYVSSYTYKMSSDAPLPEITVELKDSLAINQGVMKNIASQVEMSVMSKMASIDVAAQGARAFLLRGQDDSTAHKLSMNELEVKEGAIIGSDTSIGGSLSVGRKASFNDTIESKGDITVGEYTDVLGEVQGAKIGQDGSARFSTIKANSMEVFTINYNQIRSTSAYTAFDDSATIVELKNLEDGTIEVGFEPESTSASHPFKVGDILFGYVNGINNFAYSKTGRCWLNVTADIVEGKPWHIRATMFDNEDCPDGENINPTTNMVVMHRGNNNEENKERQRTFYISSKDGYIVQLLGVTSPKLYKLRPNENGDYDNPYSNYGVVMGKLPEDLFEYVKHSYSFVKPEDPILYAKYLAVQNLLQIDFAGRPIKTERFRGEWDQTIAISDNPYRSNDAVDVTYYDTVTFGGSKWQCLSDKNSQAPSEGRYWLLLVAKGADGLSPNPNLLLNTNFESYDDNGVLHWDTANGTISPSSLHNGYKYIQSSGAWTVLSTNTFGLDANGVYTLSLDYKTDSASDWNYPLQITSASRQSLQVISSSDNYIGSESGSLISAFKGTNGEWRRVYITFKIASSTQTSIPLNFCNDDSYRDSTKSLYISQIKLEQGYNATPYRVSDEDLKGADGVDIVVANLFDNANFEKTVTEGSSTRLESWGAYVTNSYPVTGKAFEGYNSYRVGESESFILAQEINLGAKEYTISFCLNQSSNKKGWIGVKAESGAISVFEPKNSTSHTLDSTSTELYDKRYFISTERVSSYEYFTFRLGLSKGSSVTILFGSGSLSYYVYVCQPQIQEGSKATSFTKSQLELAGPAGEAGPAAYPMGEWNSSTTYKKTYNTVPFVYYAKDSKYYVLNADSAKGSSQSPEYTEYWSVFTQFEQLYVKFLMANWALFGGDNGGVFYNGMLFSQDGVTHFGESSKFGSHMSGDYPMFDNKGKLTGNFVPNLFFNFADGAIKAGRFSEPFSKAEKKNNYYAIDPYKNHNVFIDMTVNSKYNKDRYDYALDEYSFQFRNDLILLPEYDSEWAEDGQHFSITTNAVNGDDTGLSNYGNSFLYDSCYNIYNLLAVDECMVSTESSYNDVTSASYSGNWIIWKGLRAKFMLLTPNTMLRLRLQIIKIGEEKVNFWHVENSEDFEAIKARLYVTKDSLSETEKIENEPTNKAFSMGFNTSNAAPHINLVTGFDADTTVYKPIILAPAGKFSVAYSDLERQGIIDNNSEKTFDILYSIGNALNNTYSHSVKTMRPSEFKF